MLLIQAIRYLIDQIDANLMGRLGVNISPEKVLADKFKGPVLPFAPMVMTQTDNAIDIQLINQLEALKLVEIDPEHKTIKDLEGIDHTWLGLPSTKVLKQKNPKFMQQTSSAISADIDAMPLHLGVNWGQLMSTTYDEFSSHLSSGMKNEDLTFNKMLILLRFKRQLILLSAFATKVLVEREKVWEKSQGKLSFENSVDKWLMLMIAECFDEGIKLCKIALDNMKSKLGPVAIEHGAGETEGLLNICNQVVKDFVAFCQSANDLDGIKKHQQNSMIDLFPKKTQSQRALRLINEKAAQDLVERLFKEATYQHYPKAGWYFSHWNPFGFSPSVAEDKRKELAKALHAFEEIAAKHKEETPDYWDGLLQQSDQAFASAKKHLPMISMYVQQSTKLWEEVHDNLLQLTPFDATAASDAHRKCKFV